MLRNSKEQPYEVITDPDQATPGWLTWVLRRVGILDQGEVMAVQKEVSSPFGAVVAHLQLSYSDAAPERAPARLFLKLSSPGSWAADIPEMGKLEVRFYNAIANRAADLPVPFCYDAVYSEEMGKFHLLLEDLSKTHFPLQAPLPPTRAQCEQVVDALARLHAHWWQHPALDRRTGEFADDDDVWDFTLGLGEAFPRFVDFLGEGLFDDRRRMYERVIASAPDLAKRLTEGKAITLTHGDAHAWNFLYPKDPTVNTPCLVDWDCCRPSVGGEDLAFLIGLFWFPERRTRMEQDLVRRYHGRLLERGVSSYDWDACWHDYRWGVIRNLFRPIGWWLEGMTAELWWPRLERILLAFQDLGCAELSN